MIDIVSSVTSNGWDGYILYFEICQHNWGKTLYGNVPTLISGKCLDPGTKDTSLGNRVCVECDLPKSSPAFPDSPEEQQYCRDPAGMEETFGT
jgi:hypothetical protein